MYDLLAAQAPSFLIHTLSHVIVHQVLPTQPLPSEAEDFPMGGKYPKDVPVPTFLANLQPV